eukprot:980883_1
MDTSFFDQLQKGAAHIILVEEEIVGGLMYRKSSVGLIALDTFGQRKLNKLHNKDGIVSTDETNPWRLSELQLKASYASANDHPHDVLQIIDYDKFNVDLDIDEFLKWTSPCKCIKLPRYVIEFGFKGWVVVAKDSAIVGTLFLHV